MVIACGDTICAKSTFGGVKQGDLFTVLSIGVDGTTILKSDCTGAIRLVSSTSITAIFSPVVCELNTVEPKREWSDWTWTHNQYGEFGYRTNGKNVQVELWNGFRAKASCHPEDEFVLENGIALAFSRAAAKFARTVQSEFERQHAEMFAV